jgi:hypothetical protein
MRYSWNDLDWNILSTSAELVIDLGDGNDILEVRGFDPVFGGVFSFIGGSGVDQIIIEENVTLSATQIDSSQSGSKSTPAHP